MYPTTQEEWWQIFKDNQEDIMLELHRYINIPTEDILSEQRNWAELYEAIKHKDHETIERYLFGYWDIHPGQGGHIWGIICNLLSEAWVFEE